MRTPEVHTTGNTPSAHPEAQLNHNKIRASRLAGLHALRDAGVGVLRSGVAQRLESDIVAGTSPTESVDQITGKTPSIHAEIQDNGSGSQSIPVGHNPKMN